MKKEFSSKNVFVALSALIILVMMIVPLSVIVIDVMVYIEIIYVLAILIYTWSKHRSAMPLLCLLFVLYALIVDFGLVKEGLLGMESGRQVPVVMFLSNLTGERTAVINIVTSIVLLAALIWFVPEMTVRKTEVKARYMLDGSVAILYGVSARVESGDLSQEEANFQKKKWQDDSTFYSEMDGSARFVNGCAKLTVLLSFISFVGGILIMKIRMDSNWRLALEKAVKITSGNIIVFAISLLVVSLCIGIKMKTQEQTICCFCKKTFRGMGNSTWPIYSSETGEAEIFRCCDECNEKHVIPVRKQMK